MRGVGFFGVFVFKDNFSALCPPVGNMRPDEVKQGAQPVDEPGSAVFRFVKYYESPFGPLELLVVV